MKKVLVIDDPKQTREVVEFALENSGYVYLGAADGSNGLDMTTKSHPQMIFPDLNLPEMDGVTILKALRERRVDAIVYIVFAFLPEYLERLSEAARQYHLKITVLGSC